MSGILVDSIEAVDARFPLPPGAGSDAVHTNPVYSMALTSLRTGDSVTGTGLALTLGEGNRLVCEAIGLLAQPLAADRSKRLW
jgi:L-fuconate dehydratase